MAMSLLHPLAETSLQWINCRNQAAIDFDNPQPVLLNGNIYMKGKSSDSGQLRLWKYSMSAKLFSEILCPPKCNVTKNDRYLLVSLDSHLLLLRVHLSWPDPRPDPIYTEERYIDYYATYHDYFNSPFIQSAHMLNLDKYELLESGWINDHRRVIKCVDPLPVTDWEREEREMYDIVIPYEEWRECRSRDPQYWDVSAAVIDKKILIAFLRKDDYSSDQCILMDDGDAELYGYGHGPFISVEIMTFNTCSHMQLMNRAIVVPRIDMYNENVEIIKPLMFVHRENVYLKVWNKFGSNLQYASMKSITDNSCEYDSYKDWHSSHSITEMNSNVIFVNGQVVVGLTETSQCESQKLYLCTLTACRMGDTWAEIACFKAQFNPAPIIMGQSDGSKLVAIGMHTISESCQGLHVLEVVPRVVAYHPQNKFSLSAVNRIQVGANINLLPTLEQKPESLSDLQMEAGFNLACSIDPFYSKKSFVAKYISGWVDCPSSLPPTWKNLLMVLKQLKEVSLANKIEKYLTESTEHVGKHGIPKPINASGSEEMLVLKTQLDSLYQAANDEGLKGIKEKVKICCDQLDVALHQLRVEKQKLRDDIDALIKQKEEVQAQLKNKEQELEGLPPAKRLCLSETQDTTTVVSHQSLTLKALLKELSDKTAGKWEDIGIHLGIKDGLLDKVKSDNSGNTGSCLREMLRIWLKRSEPTPSWEELCEALNVLGEEKLAKNLKEKYIKFYVTQ